MILGEKNRGKGAALSKAIEHSTGDIIIFQDADLEYDPEDYKKLVEPFVKNKSMLYMAQDLWVLQHID